jgi:hypothetical protein
MFDDFMPSDGGSGIGPSTLLHVVGLAPLLLPDAYERKPQWLVCTTSRINPSDTRPELLRNCSRTPFIRSARMHQEVDPSPPQLDRQTRRSTIDVRFSSDQQAWQSSSSAMYSDDVTKKNEASRSGVNRPFEPSVIPRQLRVFGRLAFLGFAP